MHLKQTRQKSGKTNLSIVESWWDPDTKRSRQRTVENLGFLKTSLHICLVANGTTCLNGALKRSSFRGCASRSTERTSIEC
jgi:hypothetical protein